MGALNSAATVVDPLSQSTLDLLPAAAFVATVPDGRVTRMNGRAAALCGRDSAASRPLWDMLRAAGAGSPAEADPIAVALQRATPVEDVGGTLETCSGVVPVVASIAPLHAADGRAEATLTLCHPLPSHASAAFDLHRSQERLTLALSAGRLGAWEFRIDTGTLTASPQCKANHGLGPDHHLDLEADIIASIDREQQESFRAALSRAIAERGAFEIEVPNRWPDGSRHWLLIAGRMIDSTSLVGVTRDVTERRRTEEALITADRSKDEFLALLAHELRGPLAPIVTAVKLLEAKGPGDPGLRRLRDTILRQALQLTKLVDDLLDIGRIINGKLRLESGVLDLRTVVQQAVETCSPFMDERHHTLVTSLPEAPVQINGDLARLVQVLCNILNNAAKYMDDGGRIELSLVERPDAAVITVRDHGLGIAPDMLERIFQRFVQVDASTNRSQGGLGIGLALVRALVDLHGGTVTAFSDGPGTGSEFVVRLPLLDPGASPPRSRST